MLFQMFQAIVTQTEHSSVEERLNIIPIHEPKSGISVGMILVLSNSQQRLAIGQWTRAWRMDSGSLWHIGQRLVTLTRRYIRRSSVGRQLVITRQIIDLILCGTLRAHNFFQTLASPSR